MGTLDTTLGEAERLYREMQSLAQSGDPEGKNRIVKLRSHYAMLMLEILQAIEDDTQGYMKSAAGLNSVQDDFYRWVGTNFSLH